MHILWPDEVAEEIISHFRHTLNTGESYYSPRFVSNRQDETQVESYEWELHRMTMPDGKFGVICYYFDSTKLRIAENALGESEGRLKVILNNSPDAIFLKDRDGRLLLANPATLDVIGKSLEECLGKTDIEICDDPEIGRSIMANDRRIMESGKTEVVEETANSSSGPRVYLSTKTPLHDDNWQVIGLMGISREITDRKIRESNSEFLAGIDRDFAKQMTAKEIMEAVGSKICDYLKVETCNFCDVDDPLDEITVVFGWRKAGAPDLLRTFRMSDYFSDKFMEASRNGETVVIQDTQVDPRTGAESYAELNLHSFLSVPFLVDGKWKNSLTVTGSFKRDWQQNEIELFQEIANRVFTRIERARAEEALRKSEENLKRAQTIGKIGSWRLDLAKNELVWSDENYRIFGVKKGSPQTYDSFLSIVHPDDREYVDRKWRFGMQGEDYDLEHRVIANGKVKWVREKAFLEFDKKGALIAGFGITQDITDKKNAEYELEKSRLRLDLALENANVGLWEWDLKTDEVIWDERSEKMFGLIPGSYERKHSSFEKLVHEEDIGHVSKAISETRNNGAPYEVIYRTKPVNGKIKYISSKALVHKDEEGNITGFTGVNFDITDLKEGTERLISKLNEDLLRSNKELENFAYITSHDLQEPLRMVSSFTQLLARNYGDKLDDRAKEYIEFAVEGAKRMYDLINGLLAYSRISRKEITFSDVDLNDTIKTVMANLALVIKEKNCNIQVDDLPSVRADRNQMIQLFQNLIANGIKFSNTSPRIYVGSREEKTRYVFSVRDEGIGIEPQYFERIFHIFKRLMPREEYEGTGIGLSICKRIVENHGGEIWVESEPGKGSVFYFSLPAVNKT
jgi:PAS domain S-box-containing protein